MRTNTAKQTFTAGQQAVRARLATLNPAQFDALKSVLQQSAAAIDIRLAQLEAERAQLTDQKAKLLTALSEFGKPAALDKLRSVILKGERFTTVAASLGTSSGTVPKRPKKPGR
jgi:hypothetical protein